MRDIQLLIASYAYFGSLGSYYLFLEIKDSPLNNLFVCPCPSQSCTIDVYLQQNFLFFPQGACQTWAVFIETYSLSISIRTVSYICTVPPLSDSLPCRPQSTANSQRLPASLKHLSFRLDHQGFALYNSRPNETRNCLCYPSGFHHVQKSRQAPESSKSGPCSL